MFQANMLATISMYSYRSCERKKNATCLWKRFKLITLNSKNEKRALYTSLICLL